MKHNVVFEEMNEGEEEQIFELIRSVFKEFIAPDFSPEGINTFMEFILPGSILKRRSSGNNFLITAKDGDEVVGVIEVKDYYHISLLFVSKNYHHQGVATKLFKLAREKCKQFNMNLAEIEVNASRYAVPVYEKLGFRKVGEEQVKDGILFTPMKAVV